MRNCWRQVVHVFSLQTWYTKFFKYHISGPQIRVRTGKLFSYFSTQTYVVGTQKKRLNETVLLSTQNTMFKLMDKKIMAILCSKVLRNWLYDIWPHKHTVSITFFKTLFPLHRPDMTVAVDCGVKQQTKPNLFPPLKMMQLIKCADQ